jgi:sugar lactone lactonase YvrE
MKHPVGLRTLGVITAVLCGLADQGAEAQTINTYASGPLSAPEGVAFGPGGILYVANNASNTLSAVAPNGAFSVLVSTGLNLPNGVAVDTAGNVYVANTGNATIAEITPSGSVSSFVGPAQGFTGPQGLAFDGSGNLYVSDLGTRQVLMVTPAGVVSTFVDNTHGLVSPIALAFDSNGNLYIADEGHATISKVTPSGGFSTFASGFFVNGGLAFDAGGNLYATDSGNSLIRKITPGGAVSTFASAFAAWGAAIDGNGNLFFASRAGNTINKVTPAASVSQFVSSPINTPEGLVFDGSGNLFVANQGSGTISEIATGGAITTIASGLSSPASLVMDQTGNLYVAAANNVIQKITPGGAASTFATQVSGPIAFDQGGNLYGSQFSSFFNETIVKISPSGSLSPLAQVQSQSVSGLAVDASGNVFAALSGVNFSTVHIPSSIVEIAPNGSVSTFAQGTFTSFVAGSLAFDSSGNLFVGSAGTITKYAASGGATPALTNSMIQSAPALAFDGTGNLYVADSAGNVVYQILLVPSPLVAAILPGSRSVKVGVPATVFTTIVNASGNQLANCLPSLPLTAPAQLSLDYRPTNPATNTVIGVLDQPVTIPANGSQSFVLGFNASAPVTALNQSLVFSCGGVSPAPNTVGVNTLDLLFSATPVPDIVALVASGDPGYVDIPGATGTGVFAVATINLGIDATITASANTGTANLPVTLAVCETNPLSGVCLAAPAPSATTDIQPNATPTFGIFVAGSAAVANSPGVNRVFVTFTDGGGTLRGETSVAVRTQ